MIKILFTKYTASVYNKFRNRFFGNGIYSFLMLLMLFLSGCGTIAIDKKQSALMPRAAAMSIFEKYGFKQWAEKPAMFKAGFGGNEKQFIEFNQIEVARYCPTNKSLFFLDERTWRPLMVSFNNVTEAQALELTNAVRALGATKIEQMTWMY
jgi:hypothetical protein